MNAAPLMVAATRNGLGVFAARIGDREQALDLFERGYAEFALDPFDAPDEYSSKVFPEKVIDPMLPAPLPPIFMMDVPVVPLLTVPPVVTIVPFKNNGFPLTEVISCIQIVHEIRNAKPIGKSGDYHPLTFQ